MVLNPRDTRDPLNVFLIDCPGKDGFIKGAVNTGMSLAPFRECQVGKAYMIFVFFQINLINTNVHIIQASFKDQYACRVWIMGFAIVFTKKIIEI